MSIWYISKVCRESRFVFCFRWDFEELIGIPNANFFVGIAKLKFISGI